MIPISQMLINYNIPKIYDCPDFHYPHGLLPTTQFHASSLQNLTVCLFFSFFLNAKDGAWYVLEVRSHSMSLYRMMRHSMLS